MKSYEYVNRYIFWFTKNNLVNIHSLMLWYLNISILDNILDISFILFELNDTRYFT